MSDDMIDALDHWDDYAGEALTLTDDEGQPFVVILTGMEG